MPSRRVVSFLRSAARAALLLPSLAVAATGLAARALAAQSPAPLVVRGLRAPVTLARDSIGIVHIRAQNEHDLFFAQGFSVARDRLFQLEVWRRFATGTWAEVLGPRAVETDRAMRQLRFRGDVFKDLAHYHPRGGTIAQAFVDGINAWVARTEADPSLLTPEFALLGMRPGRWTPAVVISRHNGLFGNASDELELADARAQLGDAVVAALTGETVLDLARVARDPAVSVPASVLRDYRPNIGFAFRAEDIRAREGSNNWAIAGAQTASGKPFVANDPHRALAVPSLRYLVHLSAPGWEVIGAGEPALPGVAIGRNRAGAWGLTIWSLDNEDLLSYPYDAGRDQYRGPGGWQPFREEVDTIAVRGGSPVVVTHRFTRDGPLLRRDSAAGRVYALRRGADRYGTAPYLASLRIDQARSWPEFRAALEWSGAPGLNWVWGDTSNVVGWQVAGWVPRRRGYSGATPVRGDTTYDWTGRLAIDELPHRMHRGRGAVLSANERNTPGTLGESPLGWAEDWRARRIRDVLDTISRATIREMSALQHDETPLALARLRPLLRDVQPRDARSAEALRLATAWNGVLDRESVGGAIAHAWRTTLVSRVQQRLSGGRPVPASLVSTAAVIDWAFAATPGRRPEAAALADSAFHEAVATLAATRGGAPADWRYGDVRFGHRAVVRHPLSPALPDSLRARFDLPLVPRGGDGDTPNATGDGPAQRAGASFRLLADLAHPDSTWVINTPGQSGDVRSPYYANLYGPWAEHRVLPAPFTRAAVDRATAERVELRPVTAPGRAGSDRPAPSRRP